MLKEACRVIQQVREKKPLVHAITNYVTVNDCANILLGFGASPAMVEIIEEVEGFTAIAQSLYINIGTLAGEQKSSILLAAARASELHIPVVIDPVGVGAIPSRADYVLNLLKNYNISIVKGNLGEIKVLAGLDASVRGVDSIDDGAGAVDACRTLAEKYNTVVVASGVQDIISDGKRVALVDNGTSLLSLITGSGCMLGALAAAAAAVEKEDFLKAAATAVLAMGLSGETAAGLLSGEVLPGTFRIKLFDQIYSLSEQVILEKGKLSWL
ncbi:hydroxyethylthiazole kinase [Desulfofarcimen acetoxidans DSM 771]|uniref:Hydroxyethylthiazole kinase n=1 Tax=Desulfofarcimen acetoxidans (strain ATCC 49208 / DSM 771 / KCTC 5769 / VKM B-1644 / 5575) TaxID=485916 RepID=C8VWV2_DESAS|nr:hydroxyethylthiazole kinase [Desulfofarcimen acetoxidans DSM 771]